MRKGVLIAAAIVALIGAIVAGISTSQHMRLKEKGFEEASFCALSESVNCDIVNASSYSEFLGIPTAWWGLTFYLCLAGLAFVAAFAREGRAAGMIAWLMSVGGIFYSAWLAWIAFVVLGVVCIECLSLYAVGIALVILFFVALKLPFGGIMRFFIDYAKAVFGRPSNLGFKPRVLKYAAVIAVVFALGFGVMRGIQANEPGAENEVPLDEKVAAFNMQSLYTIEPEAGWAVWGNPNAKVTIVEYSDFQCPFCRVAAFNVKPYLQEFKDDVRVYFVNFPLDDACNEEMKQPMHPFACMAAKAAICANGRGDFWGFHDDLFRQQRKLNEETILAIGEKRGWTKDDLRTCIASPETDAEVKREIASARKIFVSGTPSLFLNNRKLKYWKDSNFLQAVVKEEIKKAKK